ncbi:MAG: hypothetical protein AAGE43_12860 [Pseudomonadota bacterium]
MTETPDSTNVEDRNARNRRLLLAMFAIAFLTLGASWLLFYVAQDGGVWGTTNKGTFVDPPLTAADLELQRPGGRPFLPGQTWWLWVVSDGVCADECADAVYQMRQLHVLLNKDMDRVQRGLVSPPGAEQPVLGEYPKLVPLEGSLERLNTGIYIVDPIGNLVLYYPWSGGARPVLDDLKKLLKLSQIG